MALKKLSQLSLDAQLMGLAEDPNAPQYEHWNSETDSFEMSSGYVVFGDRADAMANLESLRASIHDIAGIPEEAEFIEALRDTAQQVHQWINYLDNIA